MTEENKGNPGKGGNPGVSPLLCAAYRKTLTTEIKAIDDSLTAKIEGLQNTIILGLSISTAIISLIMYLLSIGGN